MDEGQFGQGDRDLCIPTSRGVLVAERRGRGGVSKPGHQLGERGARLSGKRRTGVPEVVQP